MRRFLKTFYNELREKLRAKPEALSGALICPINREFMGKPMLLPSGITMDLSALEMLYASPTGDRLCPITRQKLPEIISDIPRNKLLAGKAHENLWLGY